MPSCLDNSVNDICTTTTNTATNTATRKNTRRCRVVLYSHDTMGLGHMRRNLLIARALAQSPINPTILLIAGAREVGTYSLPKFVDCFVLPSYYKNTNGQYQPRHLDVKNHELLQLRSKTILSVLESFGPDVFIVDNVATGALGELDLAMNYLRKSKKTRCVLGLRDIQDDHTVTQSQYLATEKAYRDYYDAIWIYGDPGVYDLKKVCQFSPEISKKIHYTGYFDHRERIKQIDDLNLQRELQHILDTNKKLVVCTVGGGQDGDTLAQQFCRARLPDEYEGVLITGPYMPADTKQELLKHSLDKPNLHIIDFLKEPTYLISRADRIIGMGGYNSICEVLSFEKRALIVPRITPRTEQWVRAQCLNQLGLIDILHPNEITSEKIVSWLLTDGPDIKHVKQRIDFNGLKKLPDLISKIARI